MADITNLTQFLTDVATAIKQKTGKEEKIPAENFDTEILSIETGIDTSSDNPIIANDVAEGKEGFVNGEKIIGNAFTVDVGERAIAVTPTEFEFHEEGSLFGYGESLPWSEGQTSTLFKAGSITGFNIPPQTQPDLFKAIGLSADKIVKGQKIFGVEGTAEGGGTDSSVKMFESIEEMRADSTIKEGDYAIIYKPEEYYNLTLISDMSVLYLPLQTVTLSEPITTTYEIALQWYYSSGGSYADNHLTLTLTPTSFKLTMNSMYGYEPTTIEYTSDDGITYTKQSDINLIGFADGTPQINSGKWNDVFGEFVKVKSGELSGFYRANPLEDTTKCYMVYKDDINLQWEGNTLVSATANVSDDVISSDKFTSIVNVIKENFNNIYALNVYQQIDDNWYFLTHDITSSDVSEELVYTGNLLYDSTSHNLLGCKLYSSSSVDKPYHLYKINFEENTYEKVQDLTRKSCGGSDYYLDIPNIKAVSYNIRISDGYFSFDSDAIYTTDMSSAKYNRLTLSKPYARYYYPYYETASTQFTLDNPNQLLPYYTAFGKDNTVVTGDGSIYSNLDYEKLFNSLNVTSYGKMYINSSLLDTTNKIYTICKASELNNDTYLYRPVIGTIKHYEDVSYEDQLLEEKLEEKLKSQYSDVSCGFNDLGIKCDNNMNYRMAYVWVSSTKEQIIYLIEYTDDCEISNTYIINNEKDSSDKYRVSMVMTVDKDYYYLYYQYRTASWIAKINKHTGEITQKSYTTSLSSSTYDNVNNQKLMIFGDTLVYVTKYSKYFELLSVNKDDLSLIKSEKITFETTYSINYTDSTARYFIYNDNLYCTIAYNSKDIDVSDKSIIALYKITAEGIELTGEILIDGKNMYDLQNYALLDGDYIYLTNNTETYKINISTLSLEETIPNNGIVPTLYDNTEYYDFQITDYLNYTCKDGLGEVLTITDGVCSYKYLSTISTIYHNHIYNSNYDACFITNSQFMEKIICDNLVVGNLEVVKIEDGIKLGYNTLMHFSGNITNILSLYEPSNIGAMSSEEYNTALDTAKDIKGGVE